MHADGVWTPSRKREGSFSSSQGRLEHANGEGVRSLRVAAEDRGRASAGREGMQDHPPRSSGSASSGEVEMYESRRPAAYEDETTDQENQLFTFTSLQQNESGPRPNPRRLFPGDTDDMVEGDHGHQSKRSDPTEAQEEKDSEPRLAKIKDKVEEISRNVQLLLEGFSEDIARANSHMETRLITLFTERLKDVRAQIEGLEQLEEAQRTIRLRLQDLR